MFVIFEDIELIKAVIANPALTSDNVSPHHILPTRQKDENKKEEEQTEEGSKEEKEKGLNRKRLTEKADSPNVGEIWLRLGVASNAPPEGDSSRKCTLLVRAFPLVKAVRAPVGGDTLIAWAWVEVAVAIIIAKLFSNQLMGQWRNQTTHNHCRVYSTTIHKVDPFGPLHKFGICIGDWICHSVCNEGGGPEKFEDKHGDGQRERTDRSRTSLISNTYRNVRSVDGVLESCKLMLWRLGGGGSYLSTLGDHFSSITFWSCACHTLRCRRCRRCDAFYFHEAITEVCRSLELAVESSALFGSDNQPMNYLI